MNDNINSVCSIDIDGEVKCFEDAASFDDIVYDNFKTEVEYIRYKNSKSITKSKAFLKCPNIDSLASELGMMFILGNNDQYICVVPKDVNTRQIDMFIKKYNIYYYKMRGVKFSLYIDNKGFKKMRLKNDTYDGLCMKLEELYGE